MDKKEKLNLGLNTAQLKAVTAPLGPVLILAGAGSGKTRALTMRIVYMIRKLGIRPDQVLAVTFTNKAAGEMKERIIRLIGKSENRKSDFRLLTSDLRLPTMGTFHSIGGKILRVEANRVGLTSDFVIYDTSDQESLIKEILEILRIDATRFKPQLFAHIIDRAKNNLEGPEDVDYKDGYDQRFANMAKDVYGEYQKRLVMANAADFGDLLMYPVRIFQKYPEVLEKYQSKWPYILIDEYQDTNYVQYVFTKMLAQKYENIFVVGDDAQAIYGFRGANLQNILDFEKDYPKAKIIRLEQNYRSTSPILAVAEEVIKLSPRQHKKKLWTENSLGNLPVLFRAQDELVEAWFVAKKILDLQDGKPDGLTYDYNGDNDDGSILSRIMRNSQAKVLPKLKNRNGLKEIAVLYRTHAQSRTVEEAMIEAGIPYQIIGGLKFYERKEIKDILAYLKLLISPNDLISLKRVINVPPRGIGPKSFDLLKNALLTPSLNPSPQGGGKSHRSKGLAAAVPPPEWGRLGGGDLGQLFAAKPQLQTFFEVIDRLTSLDQQATLLEIMQQMLKMIGYETFLRDGTEENEVRWENVQELFNVAATFSKMPWKEGLTAFLEEVTLLTSADEADPTAEKVTLMTLHQAKGLEFETVFFIGLEEGLLPHARSIMESKDISEEVRLAYVGVTRAKKNLYLIHAQTRRQYGTRNMSVPSRILKAIPEELLDHVS